MSLAFTMPLRNSAISGVTVPRVMRSSISRGSAEKRLIERIGPSMAKGGTMAFTLDPSASLASTMGQDSSILRPTAETIRSMIFFRWASSLNRAPVRWSFPERST